MTHFKPIQSVEARAELSPLVNQKPAIRLSWHDSASHVMDDFEAHEPVLLRESTNLKVAEQLMNVAGQRYACVVNQNNSIIGLVALREFHGRKAMQLGLQNGVPWFDVSVAELMKPIQSLPQIDYPHLTSARIGDAAATLKGKSQDFIIVRDGDSVRGVVSSLRIAEVTGESVNIYHSASTFAEILSVVNHSEMTE